MSRPLTDKEIAFFKYFNKKNLLNKKTREGLAFVKGLFNSTNTTGDWKKTYYLYRQNYRPQGDYENITWNDFVDKTNIKTKRTTNSNAREYTASKMPFVASNLKGEWKYNYPGELIYVVYSYGHYPIYIFRDGIWFINSDKYSVTTAKHISRSLPSGDRESKMIMVGRDVMKDINTYGEMSNEDIIKSRKDKLGQEIENLLPKKLTNLKAAWNANFKIKFKIKKIEIDQDGDVNVIINVLGLFDGPIAVNYNDPKVKEKFRYVTMNEKEIENIIVRKLFSNLQDYLPPKKMDKYLDRNVIPDEGYLKFTFEHQPLPEYNTD